MRKTLIIVDLAKFTYAIMEGIRPFSRNRTWSYPFFFFEFFGKENMNKLEKLFQSKLISEIEERFPEAIVLKNDANYIQGIPDLIILYKNKWACLECKQCKQSRKQPNQPYYINLLNDMSFAKFIFPENKEEILNELQKAFGYRRTTRISKRK